MTDHNTDLIVYDGQCIMCSAFVRFVVRHDKAARFKFVTAHSPTGRAYYQKFDLDPDAMETNIVVVDGKAHLRMASVSAVMRVLGWPWKALVVVDLLPRRLADRIYNLIARNRYRLGRRECIVPPPELQARIIDGR